MCLKVVDTFRSLCVRQRKPHSDKTVSQHLGNKLEDEALLLLFRMTEAYVIGESLLPYLFHMRHYFV